jgi:type IX secretion system PorP/SprF family membrane protein
MWKSEPDKSGTMKKILASACFLIAASAWGQNQFHLGQYMIHQPFINPAAITASEHLNAALFYRNQWMGFEGAPEVGGLNVNMPLGAEKNNYIGLTVIRDQIGINTSHQISGTYAYRIRTGNYARLSFGMSATLNLLQSDLNALLIQDAADPLFQANSPTFAMPNFKFGVYFQRKRFYAGLSLPNILENSVIYADGIAPVTEFDFNSMHYYLHAGYKWRMGEKHALNTSFLVKEVGGAPVQGDVNIQAMFNDRFGIGTSWRSSGEVLGILTVNVVPEFLISYAYEFNYGRIGTYSSGSHEILMVYRFVPPKTTVIEVPRF